ncbi:MAG: ABC transporter permease [Candidatus Natronoplasma sp.]
MKRAFSLFLSLTKNWFRSKSGVFFSILFPIMLLLIFSTVFGGQEAAEYTIHIQNDDIVDGDETELSEAFIEALDSSESLNVQEVDNISEDRQDRAFGSYRALKIRKGFNETAINKSIELRTKVIQDSMERANGDFPLFIIEENVENITDELNDGNISAQLRKRYQEENYTLSDDENISVSIAEEDKIWNLYDENKRYNHDIVKENETLVIYWRDFDDEKLPSAEILLMLSEDDQAGPMVKGTVYGVINSFNSRMLGLEEGDTTVDITEEVHDERGLQPVDYYLPGFIAAFIMSNGIIGVTSNISEYKRNGVLKRLTATPLKKRDWILANVGQQTVLAFGLTAVMILVAVLVFGAQAYPGPYAIGLILMGAVAFCSVGIVLGGLIKDVEAASGAGNAIAFPMMFLSGAFIPIETMPDYLQTVARFLPLYYFHQGLREIMILRNPSEAVLAYLIIGIFALIFIVLAIKTTRWKDI